MDAGSTLVPPGSRIVRATLATSIDWCGLLLGALLIIGGVASWLIGDDARRQLGVDRGAPTAVPLEVPPGYAHPELGYGADARGRADKSIVDLRPADDTTASDLSRQVRICVDDAADARQPCGSDAFGGIVRVVDGRRILISLDDDSPIAARAAWQSVEFTTNLDEAAWLD
ncbi:hypothetical protein [Actinopolymorpha pittospori]|uniref:Uncharacterized protein n=1 Tax=Actinopolymorpha pittospori TaxID=648752 RepID=A0A927RDR1_9ACTN|nr:hypothetical protein [Actinopolymorpha pittospori]MBE1608415.1 hypothetical protein [Actinopolymorpha pittospori]